MGTKLQLTDQDSHLLDFPDAPPTTMGGSCELYIAIYRPGGIKVAMKRPRVKFPTEDMLRRFRREAEIWSTFEHVHILPFCGTVWINHSLYIASPWMSLGDLLAFVQARVELVQQGKLCKGPSDPSVHPAYVNFCETITIGQIAAGIEYLHSIDVVHGDVKAKNVLLDDDGSAKICDFGLTKTLDHAVTSTEQKGVGSIRWQSPELLHNAPKSAKSDVYAFGMTIAEVLTATYPFPHLQAPAAVVFAIMFHNELPSFQPLSRLGVDFEPLWSIAARCWKAASEDRPLIRHVVQQLDSLISDGSCLPQPVEDQVVGNYYQEPGAVPPSISDDLSLQEEPILSASPPCTTQISLPQLPVQSRQTTNDASIKRSRPVIVTDMALLQIPKRSPPGSPLAPGAKETWSGCISWTLPGSKVLEAWVMANCNIPSNSAQSLMWPSKLVFEDSDLRLFDLQELSRIRIANSLSMWAFSPLPRAPSASDESNESALSVLAAQLGAKNLGAAIFFPVAGAPPKTGIFLYSQPNAEDSTRSTLFAVFFWTIRIPEFKPLRNTPVVDHDWKGVTPLCVHRRTPGKSSLQRHTL